MSIDNQSSQVGSQTEIKLSLADVNSLVPEFNGNPRALNNFIACGNVLFSTARSNNEKKVFLEVVKTKLRGAAFELMQYKVCTQWEDLVQELKSNFKDEKSRSAIQGEIMISRQTGRETVKEFGERIAQLLTSLNAATYSLVEDPTIREYLVAENNSLATQAFEDGIQDHNLRLLVKAHGGKDLRKTIAYATEHAARLRRDNPSMSAPKPQRVSRPFCQICRKEGHTSETCFRNRALPTFVPGQIKREVQYLTCSYCRKPNHVASECRKRLSQNSASQQNNYYTSRSQPMRNQGRFVQNSPPNQATNTPRGEPQGKRNPNVHYAPSRNSGTGNRDKSQGNEDHRVDSIGAPSGITYTADFHST